MPGPRLGLPSPPSQGTFRTPAFVSKFNNVSGVLNIIIVIFGMVNVGIIGYNFSIFKGTWRNNLFHSELNYLVMFSTCFIGTCVNIIGNMVSPQPYATNTIHELVASCIYAFLTGLGGTVLLIQLSVYGRYFVNAFEIKILAGITGLIEALLYAANAYVLNRNASALM